MRKILGLLFAVLLSGCAMPSTVVRSPDTRPSLAFPDAPEGAVVFLDGLQMGEAAKYDGQPKTLIVEPGTHLVTIRSPDGAVLLEKKVFVESELKEVKVH
jgi:hypothetical protein